MQIMNVYVCTVIGSFNYFNFLQGNMYIVQYE